MSTQHPSTALDQKDPNYPTVFQPQDQPAMYASAGPLNASMWKSSGMSSSSNSPPLAHDQNGNRATPTIAPASQHLGHVHASSDTDKVMVHRNGHVPHSTTAQSTTAPSSPAPNSSPHQNFSGTSSPAINTPRADKQAEDVNARNAHKAGPEYRHIGYKNTSPTLHHRRTSSRLTSLPAYPSPLRSRQVVEDDSPNKDHVHSTPTATLHAQQPQIQKRKNISVQASNESFKNQAVDAIFKPTRFGHNRNYTDPFIEHARKSPSGPEQKSSASDIFPPRNNRLGVPAAGPLPPSSRPTVPLTPRLPAFQPSSLAELTQDSFALPPLRNDLPVPPPVVPSAQAYVSRSPTDRAQHDQRGFVRSEWIRVEAKRIADLYRLSVAAEEKYGSTQRHEDYKVWQYYRELFNAATDEDLRYQQRREMFMPEGVTAMRIPIGSSHEHDDGMSCATAQSPNMRGRLLGLAMARMERVCLKVKQRTEEQVEQEVEDECELTAEELDTLSEEEKKEIKKLLVQRLKAQQEREG